MVGRRRSRLEYPPVRGSVVSRRTPQNWQPQSLIDMEQTIFKLFLKMPLKIPKDLPMILAAVMPMTEKGTTGATSITQSLGSQSLLELEER